jgi:hypothetical protein
VRGPKLKAHGALERVRGFNSHGAKRGSRRLARQAQRTGDKSCLSRYWLDGAGNGQRAMSYTAAPSKFRREITNVAATGTVLPVVARIFTDIKSARNRHDLYAASAYL